MADELIAGRYTIQEELGRGASATVFRARDTLLDRSVALKVIASSLASDPEFTWRFEQEARLAARLDHPNIVTVHDVGTLPDGRAFIAMRLLEGKPLDRLMSERGQLPPNEVVSIVDQLSSALDYTHAAGLVHRDVKPSNVTIDAAGRVTLTDFGIARALDSARVTLPGLTIGTPRYMSPEQVRGEDTTPATDEYSLAVMAYEMMAGRPPFEGDGTALMYKIVHEEPPAPNSFNPWLPESVSEVIQRALSKNPEERWKSSGEFARQLKDTLATSTGRSTALPQGNTGQTTIVSTPPTAVYTTGSNPVAPASTGSGPAAPAPTQQAPAGTGPQPAAEPEQKKPTTIIPPVVLPDGATAAAAADAPRTQVAPTAMPPPSAPAMPPVAVETELEPEPAAAVSSQRGPAYSPPDGEPPPRKTALLWAGVAAVVVGAAALGAFLLMGGGDGEGRYDDDETPTSEAVASVDPRTNQTSSPTTQPQERSPTVTTGPGTPSPTPQPQPTSPPVVVTVTNSQGTAVAATATPTNTSVPPTNTSAPPTRTNTPIPPTATNTSVPPTATNTTAAGFYAKIYDMILDGDRYVVYFDTNSWNTAGGDHVVFFFDGALYGLSYYVNGVFKFTGYATHDKPATSTQMCIVSADGSGRWRTGSGNCWTLPVP